ncbi:MAG: hypothetical protein WA817_12425 [Candidatus Acidiferrum sp.]
MKRVQAVLLASCLSLAVGAVARAQMGMNFFKRPAMSDFFKPVVGGGAVYETIEANSNSPKSTMEMLVVGREMVGLKEGYWLEFSVFDKAVNGTIYSKVLITKDDFEMHRTIFQFPGAPAMEMPMRSNARDSAKIGQDLDKWAQVGAETVTVPAGTFVCQHWKKNDGKDEVWINDKIVPFSMVKEVGSGSNQVLVKVITDAKDHITGPVTPFDPKVFQQMMMNQGARGRQ